MAFELDQLGFSIRRMFQVSDVPKGTTRGGHAHLECHQVLMASSGIVDVACHDGIQWSTFTLDRLTEALYIPPGVWAEETYRTDDVSLTVLASHPYDPSDYVHDFQDFLQRK